MFKIIHVVGTRPNYVKVAALFEAVRARLPHVTQTVANTGQHYDKALAGQFALDLGMPAPTWNLGVGSAPRLEQIARVAQTFGELCRAQRPDLVVVVGDVNSTAGAAMGASMLGIPLAHVEAGLRSFDASMPEELNRMLTDRLATLLLTPSADADQNLAREGIPAERVHLVGNVMIDTLLRHLPAAGFDRVRERFRLVERGYAVCTLHRPANVDDPGTLARIMEALHHVAVRIPIVFPVHPRTRSRMAAVGLSGCAGRIRFTEPMGYLDFLSLVGHARAVVTDSGGLQEEAAFLGTPLAILRPTTERPVTLSATSRLIGSDPAAIVSGVDAVLAQPAVPLRPPRWDGQAALRSADLLADFLRS